MIAGSAHRTGLIWILGACAASVLSIIFFDRLAATWSHDAFRGDVLFVDLTHIVDPILPLAGSGFLIMGAAMLYGWRPGPFAYTLLCACIAVLVAVTIKDELKFAFGRLWPETWVNNNPSWIKDHAYGFFPFHGGTGWTSFPSGHMTVVTAPMAVFWKRYPGWRWLAAVPVALVAIGLYGADYHFVGDMIAGTLLGTICAICVLALPVERPQEKAKPL